MLMLAFGTGVAADAAFASQLPRDLPPSLFHRTHAVAVWCCREPAQLKSILGGAFLGHISGLKGCQSNILHPLSVLTHNESQRTN